jgi:coenzyme F420-0:L-glutamate ligase/coenzyme F420-1:gamma-L-glutamate ligase
MQSNTIFCDTMRVELIAVTPFPLVKQGDDIGALILDALETMGISLEKDDVVVVASTIVSKAEGTFIDLRMVEPSERACALSATTGKDPRLCEAILRSSKRILKVGPGPIIAETHHGFICASAGIDTSNVAGNHDIVCALPSNPDRSARTIRTTLEEAFDTRIAVIVSDTQGRPFRIGALGVSVGLSGIDPVWRYKGEKDLYGYTLNASVIARADEVAAAADLVMGQSNEGIPVVIVRGARYRRSDDPATTYIREEQNDLFR